MTTLITRGLALLLLAAATTTLHAQVPQMLNYQGRVAVGSTNFDGSGPFKFALVNTDGSTTYWSYDGSSAAGSSRPDQAFGQSGTPQPLSISLLRHSTRPWSGSQLASSHARTSARTDSSVGSLMLSTPLTSPTPA